MFNDLISDSGNVIMVARLNRALSQIVGNKFSTREEYQIAIYSLVNKILTLENAMQPLNKVKGETPAAVGDVSSNLKLLNDDAVDIANQMKAVQSDVARLFNLAETLQNSIRQSLRYKLYNNTLNSYVEAFIQNDHIQSKTATIDNSVGVCLLPLIKETILEPSISIGISSIGQSTDVLANLLDNDVTTRYIWTGSRLELVITFPTLSIVNRLYLDLDNYDGLDIVEFSASPDGNVYGNILSSLGENKISLSVSSGKNSGSAVLDFPPQYCRTVKIVFSDITDSNQITLRGLSLASRQYESSGQVLSTLISNPLGALTFTVDTLIDEYVSILHQISYDNVHFIAIVPGSININAPFWYRATLTRSDNLFSNSPDLLQAPNLETGPNYTVISSSSLSLGSSIVERVINLNAVTGPIVLLEDILPGSLQLLIGSNILHNNQYSFSNNTITLAANAANLSIIYQVSSLASSSLKALKDYYTPQLKEVRFEN